MSKKSTIAKICVATIEFRANKKPHKWKIAHNLFVHGLDIKDAFINWSARATKKTLKPELFCEYVVSKDPENLVCYHYK